MVGGGRRGAEEVKLNTGNVFAALETLKKKKKGGGGDKAKGGSSSRRKQDEAAQQQPPQKEVFWAPAPLTTESWADVEDDDDDYFATTAPPRPVWGPGHGDDGGKEEEDAVHAALSTPVAVVSSLWSSRQNPRIIGSVFDDKTSSSQSAFEAFFQQIREFENLLNTLTKLLRDLQGTATVVLAGLIAALNLLSGALAEHTYLFLGAAEVLQTIPRLTRNGARNHESMTLWLAVNFSYKTGVLNCGA